MQQSVSLNIDSILVLIAGAIKNRKTIPVLENISHDFFFAGPELPIKLAFSTLKDYIKRFDAVPEPEIFFVWFDERLKNADLNTWNSEVISRAKVYVSTILRLVCSSSITEQLTEFFYHKLVNRHIAERAKSSINPNLDDRFGKALDDLYTKYRRLTVIGGHPLDSGLPDDISSLFATEATIETGVTFLDEMMSGGCCPKEIYVLLGPTGGKKSLLSLQICVSRAEIAYYSKSNEVNVFFSYEMSRPELLQRAIAQAAKIPPVRLKEIMSTGCGFSNTEQPYETQIFRSNLGAYTPESVRFEQAREILNSNCRVVDFSGAPINGKSYGYGGLQEVSNYLKALEDKTGKCVRNVILDWAGAAVRRELGHRNKLESSDFVSAIYGYVQSACDLIARAHNCSVWVVHQLQGAASKRVLKPIHHSEAQYCRSFADYSYYAFTLSAEDHERRVQLLNCSKSRRSERVFPRVVGMTPYLTLIDMSDKYTFDPASEMLMSMAEIYG
ncbi:MAG TPA: DnaB-like helicase C-terminal domain-containing protein [Armatimonadota bacterium]|mgnify:CR=1 FL=1|nr:DnaB-like helicase C-terminal domain-containing protein [Armatimonadota bacterium]